jgi:endonuclease/exonuclease/phosphatase family metal-dependent hydrolase
MDFVPEGPWQTVDLSKCADVIKTVSPDFCGLNEVFLYEEDYLKTQKWDTAADQTAFLADYCGLPYHYFGKAIAFSNRGEYGNALISRHPLLEAETIPIPDPELKDEPGYYETRGIVKAKLDVAGGITVLQVHVGLRIAEHQNAVVTLCRLIDETQGPIILMGDFNMSPSDFLLDRIRDRLQEIRPSKPGYHHTFPSWTGDANIPDKYKKHPCCKIDYIFASEHFKQLDCQVHEVRVSDHMPLLATLELME